MGDEDDTYGGLTDEQDDSGESYSDGDTSSDGEGNGEVAYGDGEADLGTGDDSGDPLPYA